MNNSSGKKIPSGITKEPEQPIDLKAIYEKVKQKKKDQILNICPICGYCFTEKDFPIFIHEHKKENKK